MPPGSDFPDPLYLPSIEQFELQLEELAREPERERFNLFEFAPDEFHKAAISGGTHDVRLPDSAADPVILGIAGRPGVTLVEYLRLSVMWGALPGYSFEPTKAPTALAHLRVHPNF